MTNTVFTHRSNLHLNGKPEPHPDSIIRIGGNRGTVYQRFLSDGRWHGANGQVRVWRDIISKPLHVEVMYSAPQRLEPGAVYMNSFGDIFLIKEDGSYECLRDVSQRPIEGSWSIASKVFSPHEGLIG